MEIKSIQIPEGYRAEIDNEKGVINIVKNEKPEHKPAQSWNQYCSRTKHDGLYWLQDTCEITPYGGNYLGEMLDPESDKTTFTSKEKGEAVVALCQLMLLHEDWVGDWKPNFEDDALAISWIIFRKAEEVKVDDTCGNYWWLRFPTKEMAEDFKRNFIDLLEKAKYLL